ncbi:hypothetical protein THASP1DRAFT_25039 [Thamnocephalis sphaerospora]|uniref:EF-hand domain-containing protein n=1 Tax=Thamnocephalis sphaerospora TaxID=78915 RepID=A0A4P9XLK3_9FUNG|nr:hypothetical protein THASP1DRAFT_25039 [Thamnocephalis sphaerospora]|eukprot:RKP06686.1 hypothetical protein THASP1DRAFT_25039 [Thamnocephalis sphaerospora]
MTSFNKDQLADFKETFSLFDRSGRGCAPVKSLGDMLRSCDNGEQAITFEEFVQILGRPGGFQAPGTLAEFVQAFQVFDKEGNGFISAGELRYVLTNLGERLTDAEVDLLLRGVDKDQDGNINYEEFVKKLMSG